MLVVGRLLRGLAAVQQQSLVTGVRERVDRFRQQRRRARDQVDDEFAYRDREVRQQRGDDGFLRTFVPGQLHDPPARHREHIERPVELLFGHQSPLPHDLADRPPGPRGLLDDFGRRFIADVRVQRRTDRR